MLFPTLSGIISEPLSILSVAEEDTKTAQEFVDGVYGGALMGAVAKTLRDDSVVRRQLGDAALAKVKAGRIAGFI
jgi:hypothetical protein